MQVFFRVDRIDKDGKVGFCSIHGLINKPSILQRGHVVECASQMFPLCVVVPIYLRCQ